jgi:hypothetical protein
MHKPSFKNASHYLPGFSLPGHGMTRRAALKLLAGSVAGVVLPSATAVAAQSSRRLASQSDVGHSMAKLQIEIVTGQSAPEDTVLVSTTADHPLSLKRFRPGVLAVEDRLLDLNQALVSGALTVEPGTEKSVLLPSLLASPHLQSDIALQEYLVIDSAVQVLQAVTDAGSSTESGEAVASAEGIASTQIISLQALVDTDGTAILYVPSAADEVGLA